MSDERWRMQRDVLDRFPNYGSEGCICGNGATPDPECSLHFAIAEMERMEDEMVASSATQVTHGSEGSDAAS